MEPHFYTFWSINAPLDQARLQRQLHAFHTAGFDGVVWHPRFYPNKPPYLSESYLKELSEVILYAKSLGLAFWIYDEDGWPSGTVGGQLLKKFPNDAQRWAELVEKKPDHCLAEFKQDGKKWFVGERIGVGVDYFNPDLARHFLELTHECYRAGLVPAAWEYVEAIFCDEPEFGLGHAYDLLSPNGAIPWTTKLPEVFQQRYGRDLLPQLPRLFFPTGDHSETRVNFWELLTDLFNESFTAPINEWCARHGKRFTAHVKGEEHPLFQVPTNGSCHQFFRRLSLPGIDALERFPGNNFYPRQVSSAAQQFSDGRCMVEAFGGAGWGASPRDLENYLLWLGGHGLTDFVLHLSQYELTSAAIRDWPPSQPLHLTWREVYPEVLKRVRTRLKEQSPPPTETLVIAPYRGIMANYEPRELLKTNVHNAATYPDSFTGKLNRRFLEQIEKLYHAGMPYHIADERTLETFGVREPEGLRVGNCTYKKIIAAEGAQMDKKCLGLLEEMGMQAVEIQIPLQDTAAIQKPVAEESRTVKWFAASDCINALFLEAMRGQSQEFTCEFICSPDFSSGSFLEVFFADAISECRFNNKLIALSRDESGMVGSLDDIQSVNQLHFRCPENVTLPFVWVHGSFGVTSQTPFATDLRGNLVTSGPFVLSSAVTDLDGDLVQAGFPFLRSSLVAESAFQTEHPANSIELCEIQADAARVILDGNDLGWTWGPHWKIGRQIKPGTHTLKLELIPSGYNYFGPHHYFAGDHRVISPDQFTGRKNFADPDGAPDNTLVRAWHFRPFQLPRSISIYS